MELPVPTRICFGAAAPVLPFTSSTTSAITAVTEVSDGRRLLPDFRAKTRSSEAMFGVVTVGADYVSG